MLSVREGELVELQDMANNEWCLVCTSSSSCKEGWVPANYLKPHSSSTYGETTVGTTAAVLIMFQAPYTVTHTFTCICIVHVQYPFSLTP